MKSLIDQELFLKPIKFRDKSKWDEVRANNQEWLSPWEATRPLIDRKSPLPSYYGMIMQLNKEMRALRSISLGIWLNFVKNSFYESTFYLAINQRKHPTLCARIYPSGIALQLC